MADEKKEPPTALPAWLVEVLAILEDILKVIPATSPQNEAARAAIAKQVTALKARSTAN